MNDIPEGQEVRTARPDFSSGSLRQPAGGGVQKPFHATSQRERRHSSYQSNRSSGYPSRIAEHVYMTCGIHYFSETHTPNIAWNITNVLPAIRFPTV